MKHIFKKNYLTDFGVFVKLALTNAYVIYEPEATDLSRLRESRFGRSDGRTEKVNIHVLVIFRNNKTHQSLSAFQRGYNLFEHQLF